MDDFEEYLREAYNAGLSRLNHGANTTNCNFALFNTKQRTKAWEFGSNGLPFNLKSILDASMTTPTPMTDSTEIDKIVQKDLDDGKFGRICSNETTFKEYVFPLFDSYTTLLLEKLEGEVGKIGESAIMSYDLEGTPTEIYQRAYTSARDSTLSIIRSYKKP